MSTTPKLTMIGLYNYNNALFDEVNLPEEINKSDFINTFLLNYGEYPVIYPAWDIMKFALGVWSKKWYHSIERIILAMTEEYNPLYNFDRYELYTDTENKKEKNVTTYGATDTLTHDTTNEITYNSSITETDERQIDTDGTTTNEVSAYNVSTYQPDNKTIIDNTETHSGDDTTTKTGTDTNTLTGTEKNEKTGKDTNDMTGNRGFSHNGHLYGNIGVTESTTMLMHEIEVRSNQNILDIVAEMLFKEVCIFTY